ncbi:hypothetical protein AWM75_02385 [Aerococcus urinaehominis]|uniref:Uncharacterized protein n=1 Tax=Aerococcus urinaehominis TaxID=128944 RepID=A0A0X8FKD1_9LACT|nr:class I SAM-dependent methyltransferase [Aerococcus urinaehominis]AMB98910.1 hypothetical protein AWM75_02385 [Aerococcus urinaehominis]SDM39212.1 Putative rRNA methylase [Aerococcus urinaehominis]
MIANITQITQAIIKSQVNPGDQVLDATLGNGHDSLALARQIGREGKLYGFDIQSQALANTEQRLTDNKLGNVPHQFFLASHSQIKDYLPDQCQLKLVIFNLGYLPKADKTIITQADSTCQAISQCLDLLANKGLILIASYLGHPGGQAEHGAIKQLLANIDQAHFNVGEFNFLNQANQPPKLFIIERKK